MPEIDEDSRTIFCANLSDQVSEELLFELFLQAGPLDRVHIPKDANGRQRSFGFITYTHVPSVLYAINLYNGTKLFNRELQIKPRNSNSNGINNNPSQNPRAPLLSSSSSLPSMRIPDISSLRNPGGSNPFRNSAMIPSTSLSYGPSLPKHLSNMLPSNNRRGTGASSGISRKNEINNEGININFLLKSAPQLLQSKNAVQPANNDDRDFSLNKDGNNKNMPRNDNSKDHQSNRGGRNNDYKHTSRNDNKSSNRNDGPYNSGRDRYGRRGNSPITSSSSSRGGGGYDRKRDDRQDNNRNNGRRR